MKEIFEDIIHNHRWCDVLCGTGSTLANTQSVRENLPLLIKRHGIQSMLDVPCGDFSWMRLVDFGPTFEYIGADIVLSMIEENRRRYPNKWFRPMDLSKDPIPDVDLVFTRDCLIHLSNQDIWSVLDNIHRSSVKYVMMTCYVSDPDKPVPNIRTGDFRPLNMHSSPFNFPQPIDSIDDGQDGNISRTMSLWTKEQIDYVVKTNLH